MSNTKAAALKLALTAVAAVSAATAAPVRFAVIGDSGSGARAQYEIGAEMAKIRQRVPFEFVLMLGDNLYGGSRPSDFEKKFALPYRGLLESGVRFHAVLGNHDGEAQTNYPGFQMKGRRYYSFEAGENVEVFALDSSRMDRAQLAWLDTALARSTAMWKICFLHHPLYSSGWRHGSDLGLRAKLEPLLIRHGVSVVFSGHDHFYERTRPQNGIYYFVSGAAGKLRRGNRAAEFTAASFDADNHFMVVEIAGSELRFEAVSRLGRTVDSGSIERLPSRLRADAKEQEQAHGTVAIEGR